MDGSLESLCQHSSVGDLLAQRIHVVLPALLPWVITRPEPLGAQQLWRLPRLAQFLMHSPERFAGHDHPSDSHVESGEITALLHQWRDGDPHALERVIPLVYAELRAIAASQLRQERPGHTLQPTALLNEAYLRLAEHERIQWQDRGHFLAVAAHIMRRLLVDYARARNAQKRGGGDSAVRLSELEEVLAVNPAVDLVDLDAALRELERLDDRQARVVELRYFGGLSIAETARVLDVSITTVKREWQTARAWLWNALSDADLGGGVKEPAL